MRILGIDYGRKKIGLAVGDADSRFSEPLAVIKYETLEKGIEKVVQYAKVERVEKVVLGLSEGSMAEEIKAFARVLQASLKLPLVFADETLTTRDAQFFSIEAGIKRKKRKNMEDSYAASIILQNYLERLPR